MLGKKKTQPSEEDLRSAISRCIEYDLSESLNLLLSLELEVKDTS